MNIDELHAASYRGAEFFVLSADTAGGRKIAKKRPINSDKQVLEDLGLVPRAFTVNGVIAARRDNTGLEIKSYLQLRDSLLSALEQNGPGILIHPFYGRIENVVVITWTLNEATNKLGEADITINFEISESDGLPKPTTNVISKVNTQSNAVVAAAKVILSKFIVTYANNFQHGIDKVNDFADSIDIAIKDIVGVSTDPLNKFVDRLSSLRVNVNSLVNNPSNLATEITNLISEIDDLEVVGSEAFHPSHLVAYKRLWDYGDADASFSPITAESIEKNNNKDFLDIGIQSMSLAFSYLNASQKTYETVSEVDEIADELESQFEKVMSRSRNSKFGDDLPEELEELRSVTQNFFDDQKLTARQIITIRTNPISARSLAYQHYGSSALGERIAELNEFPDLAYVAGDVKVFTE